MGIIDDIKKKIKIGKNAIEILKQSFNYPKLVSDKKSPYISDSEAFATAVESCTVLTEEDLDHILAGIPDPDVAVDDKQEKSNFYDWEDTEELFPQEKDYDDIDKTVELFPEKKESTDIPWNDDPFWADFDKAFEEFSDGKTSSSAGASQKTSGSSLFHSSTSPYYEPKLDPSVVGYSQGAFWGYDPTNVRPSILDNPFSKLISMDIEELRKALLSEFKELESCSVAEQMNQLQYLFNKIFSYQPLSEHSRSYETDEQRFYAEIISTPGLITDPMVKFFLSTHYYSSNNDVKKKDLLLKIIDYYENHSDKEREVFDYVFKSSDYVSTYFLDNPDISLEKYFSSRIVSLMDKEDLSLLYRFGMYTSSLYSLDNLFENDKAFFMMSVLTKKVKMLTGHSIEFIDSILDREDLFPLLESFYDKLVVDKSNERVFANVILMVDDVVGIRDLINYVVETKYTSDYHELNGISSYDEFVASASVLRDRRHATILGFENLEKAKNGTFTIEDFSSVQIYTESDKEAFVSAFLENVYGINLKSAQYIAEYYGKHLKGLEVGIPPKPEGMSDIDFFESLDESKMAILKKDLPTLYMLKAICNLVNLDVYSPNFTEKLRVLQEAYLLQMQSKGFDYQNPNASFVIVEGALNNMYMNSYNKIIMEKKDAVGVIGIDDGVQLLDAGVKFDMLVTSLGGVSDIFDSSVNMASKWNTASMSVGQGICSSHLSSENMGVIDLSSPILGFANVPEYSLDMMGTSDIWTGIRTQNLRKRNSADSKNNRYFVPGNIMSDETRYGYNEILIDRFSSKSSDGEVKLQPEYMVYFKFDEDYENDSLYRKTLKTAKDFGVPIMVVDVPKVKEHERSEIDKMREELFSSEVVNHDLVHEILTRYMNNYTGSATFVGRGKMYEDFSIEGMRTFIRDIFRKASELDEEQAKEWVSALKDVYYDEKRKFNEADSAGSYKYSITSFVLDSYDIERKLGDYGMAEDLDKTASLANTAPLINTTKKNKFYTEVLDDDSKVVTIPEEKFDPNLRSVVDFISAVGIGSDYSYKSNFNGATGEITNLVKLSPTEDMEMFFIENLVLAYFCEDLTVAITDDIMGMNCDVDISLNMSEGFDLNVDIFSSEYEYILSDKDDTIKFNPVKMQQYVSKVEEMSNVDFIKIFTPALTKKSKETGTSLEELSLRLLDKKNTIGEKFTLLEKQVEVMKKGGDPVQAIDDIKKV